MTTVYDVYRMKTSWDGSVRNSLVMGGFETFDEAAQAIHKLMEIETIPAPIVTAPAVFIPKPCPHKAPDTRERSSVKHDAIDDMHRATLDSKALSFAYAGMRWPDNFDARQNS